MAEAALHLIHPTNGNEATVSLLSEQEQARAARFVFSEDASRWINYRVGLRQILGASLGIDPKLVPLIEGEGSKPALSPPYDHLEFNLSHVDDLAVVVVSKHGPVGIDLEPWSRARSLIECAEVFCHPDELMQLPSDTEERATRLLEIWTSKEALLKALGTGLSYPPPQLKIVADHGLADTPLESLEDFRLLIPDHPGLTTHRIAVAVTAGIDGVEWHDGSLKS
ncbi:4'-phosphopantetheinyl transferase family protein [Haloferula sp.]|uniref:4'-phosphopantetheinyl transferase family protein n=1 Tax=Haloferula sp. TaxID=2497595 RepID=UPI00329F9F92